MYNSVEFSNIGPPVSEEDVALFEALLGDRLPERYRIFLLSINGGKPTPAAFPIYDNPDTKHGLLNYLFSLNSDDSNDLADKSEIYFGLISAELLPIGSDPDGNIICLAIGGDTQGAVYFWVHKHAAAEGETPNYQNIYLVANDFNELLETLDELEEDAE